jgi:hypothetical protein
MALRPGDALRGVLVLVTPDRHGLPPLMRNRWPTSSGLHGEDGNGSTQVVSQIRNCCKAMSVSVCHSYAKVTEEFMFFLMRRNLVTDSIYVCVGDFIKLTYLWFPLPQPTCCAASLHYTTICPLALSCTIKMDRLFLLTAWRKNYWARARLKCLGFPLLNVVWLSCAKTVRYGREKSPSEHRLAHGP